MAEICRSITQVKIKYMCCADCVINYVWIKNNYTFRDLKQFSGISFLTSIKVYVHACVQKHYNRWQNFSDGTR
jgi:hypothetical protein